MDLNKWELILIEWVNCLKFCKPINDIQECTLEFFSTFLQKLFPDDFPNDELFTWNVITTLIKDKYPEFDYEYSSDTTNLVDVPKIEITLTSTLLLHHICIIKHQPALTLSMCKELSHSSQILLREFLEKLPTPITRSVLKEHLLSLSAESRIPATPKYFQGCGGDSPISRQSPLQDFLHTPALRSTLKRENRQLIHLRCQLSEERYENEELQEEMKKQCEKIDKLDKELSCKTMEVSNLRQKIFQLENATPPRAEKSDARIGHEKYYQSQVEYYEKEFDRLNMKLEELQEEKDSLQLKQKTMDEKCKEWKKAADDAESLYMNMCESNSQQQEEITLLQANCSELSLLLEELRKERRKEDNEASFCSEGENLGNCIIDVQLQDSLKLNAELTSQLHELNKKISNMQINYDTMKCEKEEFELKVKELEKMQEEMRQTFSSQLENKDEEHEKLLHDKNQLESNLELLNLSYAKLNERLLNNERMNAELQGKATELEGELGNKIAEITGKDFEMSALQQKFTDLNQSIIQHFGTLAKLLDENRNFTGSLEEIDCITTEIKNNHFSNAQQLNSLKNQCDKVGGIVKKLEGELDDFKLREINNLSENDALKENVKELIRQKYELDEEVFKYSERISELHASIDDKNQAIEQLELLKGVIDEKDKCLADLSQQLASFEETKNELDVHRAKLLKTALELEEVKTERENLRLAYETETHELNQKIVHLQKECEDKTVQEQIVLKRAEESQQQLTAEINELNSTIRENDKQKKKLTKTVKNLNRKIEEFTTKCKESENKYQEIFAEYTNLVNKMETVETCKLVLEEKLVQTQKEMQENSRDWNEKYEQLNGRFENVDELLKEATKTNQCLKDNLKELQESFRQSTEEKRELEARLVDRENEIRNHQASAANLESKFVDCNNSLQDAVLKNDSTKKELDSMQNNAIVLQKSIEEEQEKRLELEQNFWKVKEELENLEKEKIRNHERISSLEQTLDNKMEENERISSQLQLKHSENDSNTSKIDQLQQTVAQNNKEISQLEENLKHLVGELSSSRNALQETAKDKDCLEEKLAQKTTQLDEALRAVQELNVCLEERENSYELKVTEQQSVVKEMENCINEMKNEVSELEQVRQELKNALETEKEAKCAIRAELEKVEMSLSDTGDKLQEKDFEIAEKQEFLLARQSEWNEAQNMLQNEMEQLQRQLKTSSIEFEALDAVNVKLNSEVQQMQQENERVNTELEEIELQLKCEQNNKTELEEKYKIVLEELKEQLCESSEQLNREASERNILLLSLNQRNEEKADLSELLEKIQLQLENEQRLRNVLQEDYENKMGENDVLLQKLTNAKMRLDKEVADMIKEKEELQSTLQSVSSDYCKSQLCIQDLENEIASSKMQLKVQTSDLDSKVETISKLTEKLQNVMGELKVTEDIKSCSETKYNDAVVNFNNLELKYEESKKELKHKEQLLSEQEETNIERIKLLQDNSIEIENLNAKIVTLNEQELELSENLRNVKEILNETKSELAEKVNELENEQSEFDSKSKCLNKKLGDSEEQKLILQTERTEFETQLTKTVDELESLTVDKKRLENVIKTKQEEHDEEKRMLNKEIEQMKEQLITLRQNLELHGSEKEKAQQELVGLKQSYEARLKDLEDKLESSETALECLKNENERLNVKIIHLSDAQIELNDDLLKVSTEKQSLDEKIQALQTDLSLMESNKCDLEVESISKSETISRLNDEISSLTDEAKKIELEHVRLRSELEETLLELKEARKNRDEILKQTEDNILRAMDQARCLKSANEQTEKEIAQEKSLRTQTERELGEAKECRAQMVAELESIKNERDSAFKTLVESRRCVVKMMKAFEVIPGNENLVFDERSVPEYETIMEDIVRRYTEQSEKVAHLTNDLKTAETEKVELQKKHDKLWNDYNEAKQKAKPVPTEKAKLDKENVLRSSSGINRNLLRNTVTDAAIKLTEEERKKLAMLKQKLIITESAKCNLEKKVKELREENKTLKDQQAEGGARKLRTEESSNRSEQVSKELTQLKESYGNLRADKSVLELKLATLNKILEDRTNQLSEHSLIKEAYEKLAEDNSKTAMELDTLKFKRTRDREEYVRLLKKEKENFEAQLNKKVQEVRGEYEIKLGNMKGRMVQLYKEEVDKEMHKRFGDTNENDFLHKLIEQLRKERDSLQRKYEQSLQQSSKLPPRDVSQYGSKESVNSRRSTISCREMSSKRPGVAVRESMRGSTLPRSMAPPSTDFIEESVTFSRRRSINAVPRNTFGKGMDMEDEEGDFFNNKYLDDMKEGRCAIPATHRDSDISRISELQRRNSMYPPHLKSSYPAETQFNSPTNFKEDDIRLGQIEFDDSCRALLPGEKPRKKDAGTTSYKKPGPPTPSKNGGRASLQGNDFHHTGRGDTTDTVKTPKQPKMSTPNRIKQLFKGRSSIRDTTETSQQGTPKTKQRLSIFRKPR